MGIRDPYRPGEPHYECLGCGYRGRPELGERCPECNGQLRNIAIPRE
ncbi:rubrerythrin-like domain-containing protein [Natronococcus pandeyae]|nr:rubrerythrin-like domain-containing protein [Natronococcus pandeyae]